MYNEITKGVLFFKSGYIFTILIDKDLCEFDAQLARKIKLASFVLFNSN
jgi:hypothetical protein